MQRNVFFTLKCALFVLGAIFLTNLSAQTTIYVATNGSDVGNSGSEAEPYLTISNAVAKATAGDTVLIKPGSYTVTTNVYITKDITVRGMNPPAGVIITTYFPDPAYSSRCMRVASAGAVLEGVTLERGYPLNNFANQYAQGGGLLLEAGLVTNCVIRDSQGRHGAGAALLGPDAVMRNCVISNNICAGLTCNGGGVMLGDDSGNYGGANLLDSEIVGNIATNGAGIWSQAPDITISNCIVHANVAVRVAGGIHIRAPGALIIDSIISNNTASELVGGGVCVQADGNAAIHNCEIVNNKARRVGGGVSSYVTSRTGGILISNCVIRGNAACDETNTIYGAGIADGYSSGPTSLGILTVVDTKIVDNGGLGSRYGAGVRIYTHGTASFHNCEIRGNSLVRDYAHGAGMFIDTGSVCVIVQNCLIAENQTTGTGCNGGGIIISGLNYLLATNAPAPFSALIESCTIVSNKVTRDYGGMNLTNGVSVINSIIVSNVAGAAYNDDINADAAFIGNASYSCSPALINAENHNITNTPFFVGFTGGNYRLTHGSPGINTGANQGWMTDAFDLDGRSRIDRVWRKVDMGCYEFLPSGSVLKIK